MIFTNDLDFSGAKIKVKTSDGYGYLRLKESTRLQHVNDDIDGFHPHQRIYMVGRCNMAINL
jgi:hypothetical protein